MFDQDTSVPLVQKKTLAKMGSSFVESVASKPSSFALRQLKKFGWKEGDGLGKNLQGRSERILVKKKADASGIGLSRAEAEAAAGQWWNDAFQNAAKSINVPGSSSSGSSTSDGDSSSDDSSDDDSEDEAVRASLSRDLSTYTEEDIALFRACKGRRCGKRAGRLQTGKMKREQEADRKFLEKWGAAKTSSSGNATETLKKVMNESKLIDDSAIAAQLSAKKAKRKAEKAKRKAEKAKRKAEKAKKKKKKKKEKKAKGEKKKKKRKRTSETDDAQDAAAKKMKKKKRKEKKASSLK